MFTQNPFATAMPSLPGGFLQAFLVVMFLAVVLGTVFDMVHKGSAKYFFANMRKAKKREREVSGGELVSIAVRTAVVDVRCDPQEACFPMVPAGAAAVDVIEAPEEVVSR